LILRREGQLDRTDTIPCLASSWRHERTIMKIIPPKIDATLKSIKRTLHEKPALIPLTPDAPATFEGSLQPGQAIREQAKFIQKKASNVTNRSIERTFNYFPLVRKRLPSVLNPFGFRPAEAGSDGCS